MFTRSQLGDLSHARDGSVRFAYSRGTRIFAQGEPADYFYRVIGGAVRTHKLLSDGRRQIGVFHLPGDTFGLENGDCYRFTAEAIVETSVRRVKRPSLELVAQTDPAIVHSLLTMTTENHVLLLGRKTAPERAIAESW